MNCGGQRSQFQRTMGPLSISIESCLCTTLQFTNIAAAMVNSKGLVDHFHEIHKMIDAFNQHYADNYVPLWLNVLNESMSSWLSKFCPGFTCVSWKPQP